MAAAQHETTSKPNILPNGEVLFETIGNKKEIGSVTSNSTKHFALHLRDGRALLCMTFAHKASNVPSGSAIKALTRWATGIANRTRTASGELKASVFMNQRHAITSATRTDALQLLWRMVAHHTART